MYGDLMGMKNKKVKRTVNYYYDKHLYFDKEDPFQLECVYLLSLCGHKQAKFLGLLAHDFIARTGINFDENMNKDLFQSYMKILEHQSVTPPASSSIPFGIANKTASLMKKSRKEEKSNTKEVTEDEFMSKEDLMEMSDALSAFGY